MSLAESTVPGPTSLADCASADDVAIVAAPAIEATIAWAKSTHYPDGQLPDEAAVRAALLASFVKHWRTARRGWGVMVAEATMARRPVAVVPPTQARARAPRRRRSSKARSSSSSDGEGGGEPPPPPPPPLPRVAPYLVVRFLPVLREARRRRIEAEQLSGIDEAAPGEGRLANSNPPPRQRSGRSP
jgi:hypothetical protein